VGEDLLGVVVRFNHHGAEAGGLDGMGCCCGYWGESCVWVIWPGLPPFSGMGDSNLKGILPC
jgi:hypothetical protein